MKAEKHWLGVGGNGLYRLKLGVEGAGYERLKREGRMKDRGGLEIAFDPEISFKRFEAIYDVAPGTFARMISETNRNGKDRFASLESWAGLFKAFSLTVSRDDDLEPVPKTKSSVKSLPYLNVRDGLKSATRRIEITNNWLPFLHMYRQEMMDAIRGGIRVRLLLMNPASPLTRIRSAELGLEPEGAELEIRANLRELSTIYDECKPGPASGAAGEQRPIDFEVRCHNSIPSMALYFFDETCYQGFFWQKKMSVSQPHYEIDPFRNAHLYNEIVSHFNQFWDSSFVCTHSTTGEELRILPVPE